MSSIGSTEENQRRQTNVEKWICQAAAGDRARVEIKRMDPVLTGIMYGTLTTLQV